MFAGPVELARDAHGGVQDAAGGDACEEALLARERAQAAHRLLVADEQLAVEQREVEDLGRVAVLERAQAVDALAGQRLGGHDLQVGPVAAQPPGAAHQRAARAQPGDEDVDVGQHLEDLLGRAPLVREGVRRVAVLERHEERRIGLGELARHQHGAVRALIGRREDDVGAEQPHQLLALGRRAGRHDDRHLEAAHTALHRERDAGVAAGRLEDAPPGPELAGRGGGVEHRAAPRDP